MPFSSRTHTHAPLSSADSLSLVFSLVWATEESENFSIFAFFLFSSSEQETKHKLLSKNQSSSEIYGGFIKIPAY